MKFSFDKSWTLFLDRDGVINTEIRADYVKKWEEFHFEDGALEALKKLNAIFGTIVVVTNQRGVGINVMTREDLNSIHALMIEKIENAGGRIDRIYVACDAERESKNRKPYPAMGHLAKNDFPHIDFSKSLIIGNSSSDMDFGRSLGMMTVYIDEKKKYNGQKTDQMDAIFDSLKAFTDSL